MRAPRIAVVAVLVSLGPIATAQAQNQSLPGFEPKDAAAAEALRIERQAVELINRADRRVRSRRESCRPTFPSTEPRSTQDAPEPATLDALAPLRRPATPNDPLPQGSPIGRFGVTYVNFVRRVTAANGQQFTILIARRDPFPVTPPACVEATRKELTALLAGRPRALRAATLRIHADLREQEMQAKAEAEKGPQDGVFLFTRNKNGAGSGGGGGGVESFRTHGNFTSSGGGGDTSTLSGLLPDGVAQITLEYPRSVSRGPLFKPTVYPSAYRRTVRVQQNVVSLRVPRGAGDAFPARMVWRDATGQVIRVVRQQRR